MTCCARECLPTLANASWATRSNTTSYDDASARCAVDGEFRGHAVLARAPVGRPAQRPEQPAVVQVSGRQRGHQRARLGEVRLRGFFEQRELVAHVAVRLEAHLDRARQHHDAGEALREGVVDLAGEPLALRMHTRQVLGIGELLLRRRERRDECRAPVGLSQEPVDEKADREGNRHIDQARHDGADHRAARPAVALGVRRVAGDGERHSGKCGPPERVEHGEALGIEADQQQQSRRMQVHRPGEQDGGDTGVAGTVDLGIAAQCRHTERDVGDREQQQWHDDDERSSQWQGDRCCDRQRGGERAVPPRHHALPPPGCRSRVSGAWGHAPSSVGSTVPAKWAHGQHA